jgi:hypothetical protein
LNAGEIGTARCGTTSAKGKVLDFRFPGPETPEFEAAYQAALMGQLVASDAPSPKSLQQLVQWIRKLFVERGSQ